MFTSQLTWAILQLFIVGTLYFVIFQAINVQHQQKEITFIRHGARSPNKYNPLDQELWKNYKPGHLTEKGFLQLQQLGQSYQTNYFYDDNANCIYQKLNFISSLKPRVIHSFIAFIQGLCPNNFSEILKNFFQDYFSNYSKNEKILKQILQSNFTSPFDFDFETFQMDRDFLFHGHSSSQCPILDQIELEILNNQEYLSKNQEFKLRPEFQEVFTEMKNSNSFLQQETITINQMKTFYGGYKCNRYQGFERPVFSLNAQKYLDEIFIYKFYNIDNSKSIQHFSALTEIFQWIIKQIQGDHLFSIYFGHDSNQIAILAVLIEERLIPPFASQLKLIIKGEYANLYFQNELLETKICRSKINCTRRQLIKYLEQYISKDLNDLCQI
ncbi:unnamed protein product [Paramecium sonneborni]|uniref:Histidine phosphatase family (Branch 2) protein n=1 Tax=Paramecium sonneborni TaxID=65129 RepID=A0A8S1KU90_9CILI|nr:unnamed protein product [Paramecium sonneborni]